MSTIPVKKKEFSAKAKAIASRMAEMSDDCGRYEHFDENDAAEVIDELLGPGPSESEEIRRLEIALQSERDCVLRQQRELNRLKQQLSTTESPVIG